LLGIEDEGEFVARTTASLGPQPPNFEAIVAINRGPLRAERTELAPLTPRQVDAKRAEGAMVVDVRTDLQFDDAHIPDAVCNPAVRAGFGTKLAWVADRDVEIVFVGRDDDDAIHAARLAAAVGIDKVGGYLGGGMTSWREEKRPTASVERIDVSELHRRLDGGGAAVQVLDVRERDEWEERRIPGSVLAPYHDIHSIPDGIEAGRPLAVICSSGQRSALAGSLLLRHGAKDVIHVAGGGVGTWAAEGWPVEEGA
jgi:hydroxyacylglutathione hydrolase